MPDKRGRNHDRDPRMVAGGFDWRVFDEMPPELREFYNYASFGGIATSDVVEALESGMPVSEVLRRLRWVLAEKMKIDKTRVWSDPNYPDLKPMRK